MSGQEFTKRKKEYEYKKSHNKMGKVFCSISCSAKYQFRGARKDMGLPVKQD